ncbi:hypothetical protein DMA12_33300 [Amycolatopsis balhimycina DSM 5908]|uniref:Uncharacterized protein n=1 Tax=Amycolatopsis balhimycina DSM 5908 TaxID=1081091 RepID=A0A428W5V1_AMYBA|nr:hypothetical protein [Amycolatopsis balhimycina]RSM38413.1 hypothetical protein DMA12_33300 [Amycolatopsis balhimycina DSM 5908]
MSPSERTGPLERRYRRLLRLLPAGHRAARGEELIGLLLDLDAGRARPSFGQAAGVIGLALRLRLPGAASLLITAFLVAFSTEIAATAYRIGAGAMTVGVDSRFPVHNVVLALLIPALLRLAVAAAWIFGARRLTLAACVTLLAYSLATGGLLTFDLVVFAGLGAAAACRCRPARRLRMVLLATVPFAMLVWALSAAWDIPLSLGWLLSVTAAVALAGTVGGRWPRRPDGPQDHPASPNG